MAGNFAHTKTHHHPKQIPMRWNTSFYIICIRVFFDVSCNTSLATQFFSWFPKFFREREKDHNSYVFWFKDK